MVTACVLASPFCRLVYCSGSSHFDLLRVPQTGPAGSRLKALLMRVTLWRGRPTQPTPSHLLSLSPKHLTPALPHCLVTHVGPRGRLAGSPKPNQSSCPPYRGASWSSLGHAMSDTGPGMDSFPGVTLITPDTPPSYMPEVSYAA